MANITTSFKTIAQGSKNAGFFKIKLRFVSKTKEFKLDKDVTIPYILFRKNEWIGESLIKTHDSFQTFEIIKNDVQIYLNELENVRFFNVESIKKIFETHNIFSSKKIIYLMHNYNDSLDNILVSELKNVGSKINGISEGTYKCYKDIVSVYKKFVDKNKKYSTITNVQLNQDWFLAFQKWVFEKYGYKSAITYRKNILNLTKKILGTTVFNKCEFKFVEFVEKPEELYEEILTKDEIIKIYKSDFDQIEIDWTGFEKYKKCVNLNDVKIVAMLGWHTGMRYSDLKIMNYKNVDFNKNLVRYNVIKTRQNDLKVPMFGIAKKYLNAQNNIPNMSLEHFNVGIKMIARALKMDEIVDGSLEQFVELDGEVKRRNVIGQYKRWQLFSAHMLRRSFATYMFHQKDKAEVGQVVFVDSIMKLTGHKSLETFLKYINITPDQRAEYLSQAFDTNSINFDFDIDSL